MSNNKKISVIKPSCSDMSVQTQILEWQHYKKASKKNRVAASCEVKVPFLCNHLFGTWSTNTPFIFLFF